MTPAEYYYDSSDDEWTCGDCRETTYDEDDMISHLHDAHWFCERKEAVPADMQLQLNSARAQADPVRLRQPANSSSRPRARGATTGRTRAGTGTIGARSATT